MRREQTLADRITSSSVWRSVVRHGYPDNQRNQALIVASNVFLHIHPGQDQAIRHQGDVHVLSRRPFVLHVPGARSDRRAPHVLLRPVLGSGVSEHEGHRSQRHLWPAHAKHASLVRARHGDRCLPAYGTGLLHRIVQATARIQLGDRRTAAGGDVPALVHRVSPAVGPAGLLGDHCGHPDRWMRLRSLVPRSTSCSRAVRRLVSRHLFASTRCTSSSCRSLQLS